jgi:ribonuclease VapC
MVIDTSAIIAILFDEPERQRFAELLENTSTRLVSAVTRVEAVFVAEGRKGDAGREHLNRFF